MGLMFRFNNFVSSRKYASSYPVHLTDVMDIGQSSQSGLLRDAEANAGTRTRTVREYEQTITELKKENFDLKLSVYLLEQEKNKYWRKDCTAQKKDKGVEVLIEVNLETENLREELSCKNKSLEDALERIEKLQQELQQQQTEIAELPSKEHYVLLQDENSLLQKEIESLQNSLIAKNQELEEAAHQIEELSAQNIHLEEKVKKSRIAIRGFISKHAKELELFPQEIRPVVQSAVESAKNNDYYNLVAAIKSLKSSLCEMMTIPLKECVNNSEDKENKDMNSENMCLSGETFKSGEIFGQLKRHRSDPYVPLSNLQEFKDLTGEIDVRAEKGSQSLELIHQEYSAREKMLSNSVISSMKSFSIHQLENTSLIPPQIRTEKAAKESFDLSHCLSNSAISSAKCYSVHQLENVSAITSPQIGTKKAFTTKESFNLSEHSNVSAISSAKSFSINQLENTSSRTLPQINTEEAVTAKDSFDLSHHSSNSAISSARSLSVHQSENVSSITSPQIETEMASAIKESLDLSHHSSNSAISSAESFSVHQLENTSSRTLPQINTEEAVTSKDSFVSSYHSSNSAISPAKSLSGHQSENVSSITSPQIETENAITTKDSFDLSHHSSNSAISCAKSISVHELENASSITSPAIKSFELSLHSHPSSKRATKINKVSGSVQSFADESSNLKDSCKFSEQSYILKENEYLKSEVRFKSEKIEELNSMCHESEIKQLNLQDELKRALSKIEQLEITISDGKPKVTSIVKPISTQTSTLEDQLMQFKESYKSIVDAAMSNDVDELKEEVLRLVLTIEEREKEISKLKQIVENLELELENAVNQKEIEPDGDSNEKNDLSERLALSCSVNKELMKHLHSLEAFMDDLLHNRNLDMSSVDNISETSDLFLQLSKRLDESLKFSQVLSDHLSICEGSKPLGSEVSISRDDISMSDTKSYQHLDLSALNLSKLDSINEGRRKFTSSNQAAISKFVGTGKRWSYSSQHKSTLLGNSDNVVVLGTSNNEDLILFLNENGDPADVLIRNSNENCKVGSYPMPQHGDQHRRQCWMNESVAGFDWNHETLTYQTQNLNEMQAKTLKQGHLWYGHCMSSDSDIWSEPDRDISMQRIGIDVKNSPIATKSPRKLRFKDKRTTDELSSEKNSSNFGAYKTQSWSRRRRSSGSASKRLFSKEVSSRRDCKLEKHLSLLTEKIAKFTMVSNQLEKMKDIETEESEIVSDITDELNGLLTSVNETLGKLTVIKEISKKGSPYVCEKCSIVELLLDLERTRKRIHASNLLENINETKIEQLTQVLLSEVDDLKKQLEEPHAILSSGAENSESSHVTDKVFQKNRLLINEKVDSPNARDYINKVNDQYNFVSQELKEWQSKYEMLNKDFEHINDKYNSKEQMFNDLKNECKACCKELEQSKKEKLLLEKELEGMKNENENLQLELVKVEGEKTLFKKQLQSQKVQIELLENQLQSNKDEYSSTVKEREKLIKNKEDIEREKGELKIQNKLLLNQIKELNEKYDNIFKQLRELEHQKEFLNKKLSSDGESSESVKKQFEKLNEKSKSLAISLRDSENRRAVLEEEFKNVVDQLSIVEKQLIESNNKCVSVENSRKDLEDKNTLVKAQIEKVKNQNAFLEEELHYREDQKIMLEGELKRLKNTGLVMEKEREELVKENEIVRKQLESVKFINESKERELSEMSLKVKSYEEELADMQKKIGLIEQEKVLINEKVETLKKEKECLEAEKELVSQELKNVKDNNSYLEHKLRMYNDEKVELVKDLDEKREVLNNERNAASELKLKIGNLENCVGNLKQENNNLNQEKQELARKNSDNTLQLKEVQKENNHLKNLIHNMEQKNSEIDKLCTQLQAELHNTKEQLMELDLKCSEYETKLTLESKNNKDYVSKLKMFESNLFDKKKRVTELTVENGDLLKRFEIQKDKLAILEKERYDVSEQLHEKEKELSSLHIVYNDLESKYATLLKEKNVVEEKLKSLTASSKELRKDLQAKGDHVQKLESKCINYENELLSSSNTKNNFIQKLQAIKKELFSDSQVVNEIFGFNITETISEKKSDNLDDPSLSKEETIDKLCYDIVLEHHDFLKSLAANVRHLRSNSLTLEESKAKEEQLKLELCSLQMRLQFLKSDLDSLNKQKSEMKNVIDEQMKTISKKEKMLMLKDSEIHSLRHQLLGVNNEVQKEGQQLMQLNIQEIEKGRLKEHSERLQSVINELQKSLCDKEKLLTKCDAEIHSLKLQLIDFQNESKKAGFQLNAKDDEITCLQERIFNLQTQVNNLLSEKIDLDVQMDNEINRPATDAVTSTTDLLDTSMRACVSEKQTRRKSPNSSMESSKCDMTSDESLILPESQVRDVEPFVRKINALQVKLSMATKRIEILEQEKNDLRENLLAEVHTRKKSSLNTQGNTNEKIIELETKLEKKVSFIKELKNDLYKTSDSLVKTQEELRDLREKVSALDNSKSDLQFCKDFSSNSLGIEANISSLRKHKWELIRTIFDMQKKLYEKKGIHLNHFENFKKHIENLHSSQISAKLSKSESEPILSSHADLASKSMFLNSQKFLNCVLVGLEIDIECLENLKIFLKRFFVPYILQNTEMADQNKVKSGHAISIMKSFLENTPSFNHVVEERNTTLLESCTSSPDFVLVESKKVRKCDIVPNEWSKMAWNLSQKLDHVESILKSLDSEYLRMKKMELTLEGKSISDQIESLSQKIFNENKALLQSTKLFHFNASLKTSGIFNRTVVRISSKQDLSDHESLLSEETITLSRSGSLSPVSFEENLPIKIQSVGAAASNKDKTCEKSNSKEVIVDSYSSKLQTAGSSQDSVCPRSHYSSPDLGIESDPNHDSSAPEQMEKHELCKDTKAEIKIRPKLVGRQPKKSMYTSTETSRRSSDTEAFVGGDTLHAIGILQEYELLKREVQESLIGIKSVLSRTGDGLHQIAKYTSPRKNLEYSTFRAIKDTCANIEVCLKEAYKLVNNFWIAPCPNSEEWNSLIQQNQEKCDKILMLKNSLQKQEEEFKVAMNKLQQAQLVKEQMEKKISKKLVKTKKILRKAEFKLLESECQNRVPLPNFPSESSHCQENQ
ncbi:repetitive organellar protein-like [Uloborus diversus]|uniref:repetitive organellar protein-like n=1 Tax=Uloborus diversus TaxID=327109 RepID=UPI002409B2F3|nr:repetitive organellar protein-like [Uloborus diversus]